VKKVEIKTCYDTHECETCGTSYSEGGQVFIDGALILEREPYAHCYNGTSYSDTDLLFMALKKIGVEVLVDGEQPFVSCHDDEYHGEIK